MHVLRFDPPVTPPVGRPAGRRGLRVRRALAGCLCVGLLLPGAQANSADDHDRARAAVQAGEVLPLPALLERLQRTHPGQVLEVQLEREDGRWVYELKLLRADGQLLKLEVDARSAQVLDIRRKGRRAAEDRR